MAVDADGRPQRRDHRRAGRPRAAGTHRLGRRGEGSGRCGWGRARVRAFAAGDAGPGVSEATLAGCGRLRNARVGWSCGGTGAGPSRCGGDGTEMHVGHGDVRLHGGSGPGTGSVRRLYGIDEQVDERAGTSCHLRHLSNGDVTIPTSPSRHGDVPGISVTSPADPRQSPARSAVLPRPGHFGGGHSLPGSPPKWRDPDPSRRNGRNPSRLYLRRSGAWRSMMRA